MYDCNNCHTVSAQILCLGMDKEQFFSTCNSVDAHECENIGRIQLYCPMCNLISHHQMATYSYVLRSQALVYIRHRRPDLVGHNSQEH